MIHEIVCGVDPELATFAHQGRKAYKQLFSLIHRFEAVRPNEIWQADHAPLDILILNEQSMAQQPWITAIVDDYSRAVAGYFIGFQPPSSMRIALALRQAIWRKARSNWVICGIPEKLYSDRGSDFMSNHIEQVSIDLKFERIQTEPGAPEGKGKCERFFRTVNEMFLSSIPGYAPKGARHANEPKLTLDQLNAAFEDWLVEKYLVREHSEIGCTPKSRWESGSFLPRLVTSLDQLNILLLTLARSRRVQRDGVRVNGFRYFDLNLAGYVGEDVTIRYDPRDLSHIYVYSDNNFICKATCFELCDQPPITLKQVIEARQHEKKLVSTRLRELVTLAEGHLAATQFEFSSRKAKTTDGSAPHPAYPKYKIKRFACDD